MRTYVPKQGDIQREWWLVDAADVALGRLSTLVASRLLGKHKPTWTPFLDTGDHVVVVNASRIRLTGRKSQLKLYRRHTGYPGGLKETAAGKILEGRFPERILEKAVERMIPRGPLGRDQMRALHLYNGTDHPHAGQDPQPIDVGAMNRKNKVGA